jgi:outer membrane protein TolC
MKDVERLALAYRPELREENYRARITSLETRKAILQAFPSLNLEVGYNNDTNSFLYYNDWWSAGSQISLNLFKLISQPAVYKAVKAQQAVDTMRRKALAMAVLTQVHLAYQGFQQAEERYEMSRMLDSINDRLNRLTLAEEQAGAGNEFNVIRSETNALVTRMRKILAYADLQGAMSRVINTVGLDILPERIEDTPVSEVSGSLRNAVQQVEKVLATPGSTETNKPEA